MVNPNSILISSVRMATRGLLYDQQNIEEK